VTLDWPSGRPASVLARARVQALRTAGPTEGGAPVEAEAGPDGVVLDLGDGAWQLQAEALGYWSQGAEVAGGRHAPASVRLALWPAASLQGEILTAGGDPLPRDLEVRLIASPTPAGERAASQALTPQPEPRPSSAELRCPIDDGTWSCLGPAGLFDVQLSAAGYAPRYAWEVHLEAAATTDLGRTVLRRGASVFGRAILRDGSSPQGLCRATLRADVTRTLRGAPELDPRSAPEGDVSLSAPLSRHGYFHLVGVPPGRHVLTVECEAASATRELRVQADRETRIDPPLRLEELTLDVVVTPRVDPEGRRWQLTVDATAPRRRRIADKVTASADGRWARRGLTAGSYRVDVMSSDGTQWLQRFFELGAGSEPLSLRVPLVGVAGRVLLSSQPLRARLVFFNEAGGEPATLSSDDDGRFQGLLPVAPDILETRWTVEVHAAQPPVNRRLEGVSVQSVPGEASAWLELALPVFAVRGTVVSEAGEPQSGARVTFENTSSGARTAVATDDAGSFELLELPPGSYTAVAESVEGVSERAAFEVVEGVESELQLVLNRSERVAFYVVSSQGPVADAAVQLWISPGVPRSFARTDQDGRLEAELPPGTTEVGLTVGAPGYALKLTRLRVSNEQTITLGGSGGTLVLDLQPSGRALDGSATPYLVHDGAIEAAGALAGWGTAGASGRGPAVIDTIEPGVYALCFLGPAEAELAALWRGALPSDRCRTGSVEHGQTLTLSPP
jgi:hypothetical protein